MIPVTINGENFLLIKNISILSACKMCGIILPRFCFHENLPIAGNCRACLVELSYTEKPIAACVTDLEANQVIFTDSLFAKKARENVLEILLTNHPLDCPICDQAGECDLQDQSKTFGGAFSRFFLKKRGVSEKNISFLIKTIMTRCIHCTRCVRFDTLIGSSRLGILSRGNSSEIGTYSNHSLNSELSGNVIDLCPVGALTARTYAFQTRPWELKYVESVDLTDAFGSTIYISYKDSEIIKISPKPNNNINGNLITDKCRFSGDAFTNNRLKKIYYYDSKTENYKSLSWFIFLEKLNNIAEKVRINIIVTEDIDLLSCLFLKKLSNSYCAQIKISLINTINNCQNLYVYNLNSIFENQKVTESLSCFLLASNLKLECALLNLKLKLKYQYTLLSIFCFGRFFLTSFKTIFINLNIKSAFFFFEGKANKIANLLLLKSCPTILIGESFLKRNIVWESLSFFFKNIMPTIKIYKINLFSNEEGTRLLNIQNNIKHAEKSDSFCINTEDSLVLRKFILFKSSKNFWLNVYRPFSKFKLNYLIPVSTFLESESIFLSVEKKVQKTQKIFKSLYYNRSIIKTFAAIFDISIKDILTTNKFLDFIFEILKNPHFNNYTNKNYFNMLYFQKEIMYFNLQFLKSSLEHYYISNNFTRNSTALSTYSKLLVSNI